MSKPKGHLRAEHRNFYGHLVRNMILFRACQTWMGEKC